MDLDLDSNRAHSNNYLQMHTAPGVVDKCFTNIKINGKIENKLELD